jgi:hypothetical protein
VGNSAADAEQSGRVAGGDESSVGGDGAAQRARDEQGRFAAQAKEKPGAAVRGNPAARPTGPGAQAAAAQGAPPPVAAAGTAAVSDLKPPADWRPLAKEKFKDAPREVQEEALRLHAETKRALEESAPAKQHFEQFRQTVGPFEGLIRAQGGEPMKAVGALLQREAALLQAPPQMRAQILAQGIRSYLGTDPQAMELLAQALNGVGSAPARPAQQPVDVDARVQQMLDQRIQAAYSQRAEQERQAFAADPKNEFYDRVKDSMADIMELAARRKQVVTMAEAYQRACKNDDEIAAVLKQRGDAKSAEDARKGNAGAAAASIKNEPAGPGNSTGPAKDTREEVRRQFARASRARV